MKFYMHLAEFGLFGIYLYFYFLNSRSEFSIQQLSLAVPSHPPSAQSFLKTISCRILLPPYDLYTIHTDYAIEIVHMQLIYKGDS